MGIPAPSRHVVAQALLIELPRLLTGPEIRGLFARAPVGHVVRVPLPALGVEVIRLLLEFTVVSQGEHAVDPIAARAVHDPVQAPGVVETVLAQAVVIALPVTLVGPFQPHVPAHQPDARVVAACVAQAGEPRVVHPCVVDAGPADVLAHREVRLAAVELQVVGRFRSAPDESRIGRGAALEHHRFAGHGSGAVSHGHSHRVPVRRRWCEAHLPGGLTHLSQKLARAAGIHPFIALVVEPRNTYGSALVSCEHRGDVNVLGVKGVVECGIQIQVNLHQVQVLRALGADGHSTQCQGLLGPESHRHRCVHVYDRLLLTGKARGIERPESDAKAVGLPRLETLGLAHRELRLKGTDIELAVVLETHPIDALAVGLDEQAHVAGQQPGAPLERACGGDVVRVRERRRQLVAQDGGVPLQIQGALSRVALGGQVDGDHDKLGLQVSGGGQLAANPPAIARGFDALAESTRLALAVQLSLEEPDPFGRRLHFAHPGVVAQHRIRTVPAGLHDAHLHLLPDALAVERNTRDIALRPGLNRELGAGNAKGQREDDRWNVGAHGGVSSWTREVGMGRVPHHAPHGVLARAGLLPGEAVAPRVLSSADLRPGDCVDKPRFTGRGVPAPELPDQMPLFLEAELADHLQHMTVGQ